MNIRDPKFKEGDKVLEIGNPKSGVWEVKRISKYDFFTDLYIYELESDEDGISLISFENNLKPYIEKPKSVWDLKEGDEYFLIFGDGNVSGTTWGDCTSDKKFREIGNAFLTREEAEFEIERRKIETEMLRLGGRRKFNRGKDNYYITYDYVVKDLVYLNRNWVHDQGGIYFDTDIDAINAVKTIGKDKIKKYIFVE